MDFEISKERRMSETTDLKTFPAPEPLATPTDFAEEQAKEIFTFPDTLGQLVRRVGGMTIRGAPGDGTCFHSRCRFLCWLARLSRA
jgi:hypothetical protein